MITCILVWLVLCLYQVLPAATRTPYLVAASLALYALCGVEHLLLLVVLSAVTYRLGLAMATASEARRDRIFRGGVALLLGTLLAFRYTALLRAPPGLSFYVFRLLSYLIDVYWEQEPAATDPLAFAAYATFFPQILVGPIQRAGSFFRALAAPRIDVVSGIALIAAGALKKLAADRLALPVSVVLDAPGSFAGTGVVLACYLYTLQLYLDFGGYTDIARGVGRCLGIEGPVNFAAPFAARDIATFWRRWHASLTSWLRDYLFAPLSMAWRGHGTAGMLGALTVNMLLIGAWHDLTVPFLAFGAIHAVYLCVYTLAGGRFGGRVVTFHAVVAAFVVFRARDLAQVAAIVRQIPAPGAAAPFSLALVGAAVGLTVLSHAFESGTLTPPRRAWLTHLLTLVVMIAYYLLAPLEPLSFMYQRF